MEYSINLGLARRQFFCYINFWLKHFSTAIKRLLSSQHQNYFISDIGIRFFKKSSLYFSNCSFLWGTKCWSTTFRCFVKSCISNILFPNLDLLANVIRKRNKKELLCDFGHQTLKGNILQGNYIFNELSKNSKVLNKKKMRTTFTGRQIFELERMFETKKYISASERASLSRWV